MHEFTDDSGARALERIDRAKATVTRWVISVALVEGALLIAFALLADFSNRTHLLLLLSSLLIYGTIGLSIAAVAAYIRVCTLRIISAIELLQRPQADG